MKLNCNSSSSCVVFREKKVLLVRHTYGLAKNKYPRWATPTTQGVRSQNSGVRM